MEWFESWFDSPYYEILYQHRDEAEAQTFIQNLFRELPLYSGEWILDLACGRGRHAKLIHQLGYPVYGIDLSPNAITKAQAHQNEHLKFAIQDMRTFSLNLNFQLTLSLFTSFGYFDDPNDNLLVLHRIHHHLKPNGYLVLDFLHAKWVAQNLIPFERKVFGRLTFEIQRYIENQSVMKKIVVIEDHQKATYFEKVTLFSPEELIQMLKATNFEVQKIWGDYHLNAFLPASPRCILLAQKVQNEPK